MRKTATIVMIALALVASACAEGGSVADTDIAPKPVAEKTTTTSSAPTTTVCAEHDLHDARDEHPEHDGRDL